MLDPKLALSLLLSTTWPRVTCPPLCPCPSQELGLEEHLCKRFVCFHSADLEPLLASWPWGSGSSSLQAWARFPRWCPWPVPLTALPPALLRAGPCCRVWAGVEGTRTGVWWLFSPPGRALRCLRSPIQVVPGCGSAAVTVTFLDFLCSGRTVALGAGPATSALVSASRSLHCIHPRVLFSGLGAQRSEFAVFLLRCLF